MLVTIWLNGLLANWGRVTGLIQSNTAAAGFFAFVGALVTKAPEHFTAGLVEGFRMGANWGIWWILSGPTSGFVIEAVSWIMTAWDLFDMLFDMNQLVTDIGGFLGFAVMLGFSACAARVVVLVLLAVPNWLSGGLVVR